MCVRLSLSLDYTDVDLEIEKSLSLISSFVLMPPIHYQFVSCHAGITISSPIARPSTFVSPTLPPQSPTPTPDHVEVAPKMSSPTLPPTITPAHLDDDVASSPTPPSAPPRAESAASIASSISISGHATPPPKSPVVSEAASILLPRMDTSHIDGDQVSFVWLHAYAYE